MALPGRFERNRHQRKLQENVGYDQLSSYGHQCIRFVAFLQVFICNPNPHLGLNSFGSDQLKILNFVFINFTKVLNFDKV
jgi:hypothetical protein